MGWLVRTVMAAVGFAILLVYTAFALVGLFALQWLVTNPPDAVTLLLAFAAVVLVSGYVGYSLGSLRIVASLDATELPPRRAPALYQRFTDLTDRADVQTPRLLVANLDAPNALSIGGPRRGFVVLDPSLFQLLTLDELETIIAHELAHMERLDTFYNTLTMTAMRTLVGVFFVLFFPIVLFLAGIDRAAPWIAGRPGPPRVSLARSFQWLVTLVLSGVLFVFTFGFLAYSRKQEFAADRRAAELTGNPVALARALAKIEEATRPRRGLLAMLYVHDEPDREEQWLSTHPPVQERIDRLLALSGQTPPP